MKHLRRKRTAGALTVLALTVGPAAAMGGQSATLDPSLCAPAQHFTDDNINNAYFPLPVGGQSDLAGVEGGENIALKITVLRRTERFYGGAVVTRVVEEREGVDANNNGVFDDGDANLDEISLNYFAQTDAGTVCYFGEDVDIYTDGVVTSHDGAWRADAAGNGPGIIMPAAPKVGMRYAEEDAPGVSQDQAAIVGSGGVKTAAGTFKQMLRVYEVAIDGGKSEKVYAKGVGLIVDDALSLTRTTLPH